MIDPAYYGLVELLLFGTIVLALAGWQLWKVRDSLPWRRKD
ncbi:MAG: hypothetical protein SNJ79_07210 [Sphingomonadaceae bacterium]